MREKLAELEGQRIRVRAVFSRYGYRHEIPPVKTVCLKNIETLDGELLTDHMWFALGQRFLELGEIHGGRCLELDATVRPYHRKPYLGKGQRRKALAFEPEDYRLSHPGNIVIVRR